MKATDRLMSGPIPGENFTSNSKNQPWRRPPEITDLDEAIEVTLRKFMEEEESNNLALMLDSGMDIATATDYYITTGIGKGKWSPDLAILMAGPVARIMEIMAKADGIKYSLGIEKKPEPTAKYYKEMQGDPNKYKQYKEPKKEEVEEATEGKGMVAKPSKPIPKTGMMGL